MPRRNRAVGSRGENIAARFLSRRGYRILGKNVRTFVGEIDLVAHKHPWIVFVEVKARRSPAYGPPYESVTEKKKRKLIQCALCYLAMKNSAHTQWRIDIVSVEMRRFLRFFWRVNIEHFEDAVDEM